ncbi:hypothetical protein [Mesorhizobium sp. M2A.F.Ca.ET.039.01.1.1]|uniref:hypothetical protein n=1 Tax=Mesorhizobium sp. M2A.F.Ca.ET.039.01.1.1 TaxID=2496746 RepID=UPI000FCC06C1|nr:hypothetical protein [Mesorhizobium sp. M2A.F.Ca.ET.039.01.1.1]RWX72570.1 hypothetical protein EOA24_00840 [Mesorhizobium sp. M2A.F.Ca.ET.039.01.1.1]
MKPILMSRENPDGHKLEELLPAIRLEIEGKNLKIMNDQRDAAQTLLANNKRIIRLLAEAEELQRASLQKLAEIGPDQGPRGKPRVGEGS